MKIAVLGTGRLGGSMVRLLADAGLEVEGWQRGLPLPTRADAWWVTVGDRAVPEVAALLPEDAVVLHAAGAHGPELIGERAERGVLHPLMTFPGVGVGLPDVRGCGARVEGTPRAVATAFAIAEKLGMRPFHLVGDATLYHASACLSAGHLAALFLDAVASLDAAGVPDAAALLLPLAQESLRQAARAGPDALTGPAVRGDTAAEARHLAVLSPERAAVYATLAERIRRQRASG